MTLHLTDDIIRGMSPGGVVNMAGALIFVVWTLIAPGVAGICSVILLARGLWSELCRRLAPPDSAQGEALSDRITLKGGAIGKRPSRCAS